LPLFSDLCLCQKLKIGIAAFEPTPAVSIPSAYLSPGSRIRDDAGIESFDIHKARACHPDADGIKGEISGRIRERFHFQITQARA